MFGLSDIEIQKLMDVFRRNTQVEGVVLYGSRAKGTYKPFSDVDLTLEGKALTRHHLNDLQLQIDDLLLPYQFDVSLFSKLKNESLIDHIQRRGIRIFSRDAES